MTVFAELVGKYARYLFVASGLVSLALCAFCLMHIPVIKVSTPSAVAYIETSMDGKGLVESERKMVDFELDQILFNDSRYRMVHSGLWHAGVYGFGILGSIHLLLGLVMVRAEKRARRTGGPVAPPNPLRR
ncbi:hypothetical protein [Paracidovorax oryzae]|uniref:hypothetical protein n=1 Tax=Paracidovorax oryzae TaxID=862720 RepID=UPI000365CD26|nr:hypothetical protein [Paracidovorax oryzae]